MSDSQLLFANIGCGTRYIESQRWRNFDFTTRSKAVEACNLLAGIPLADDSVDFVYSSHVLEHFSLQQATYLLENMVRILKPHGLVRIVVPNLEDICINYLQSLEQLRQGSCREGHRWATIELLDQLVRQQAGGEMAQMHREVRKSENEFMRQHILERTGFDVVEDMMDPQRRNLAERISTLNWSILKGKALSIYLTFVKKLLPSHLRTLIVDGTTPGEKHKWMYDRESLSELMQSVGLRDIQFHSADTSSFPPFLNDNLDLKSDGSAYKRSSLYAEGIK